MSSSPTTSWFTLSDHTGVPTFATPCSSGYECARGTTTTRGRSRTPGTSSKVWTASGSDHAQADALLSGTCPPPLRRRTYQARCRVLPSWVESCLPTSACSAKVSLVHAKLTFVKAERIEYHRVWIEPDGCPATGLRLHVGHDLSHLVVESFLGLADGLWG